MRRIWLAAAACVFLAGCEMAPPPATGDPESRSGPAANASDLKQRLLGEWVIVSVNGEPLPRGEDDLMMFRTDGTARFGRDTMAYQVLDKDRIELRRPDRDTPPRGATMRAVPTTGAARVTTAPAPAREEEVFVFTVRFEGSTVTLTGEGRQVKREIVLKAARYGSEASRVAVAERKPRSYPTGIYTTRAVTGGVAAPPPPRP
jgi:hypothetical protein